MSNQDVFYISDEQKKSMDWRWSKHLQSVTKCFIKFKFNEKDTRNGLQSFQRINIKPREKLMLHQIKENKFSTRQGERSFELGNFQKDLTNCLKKLGLEQSIRPTIWLKMSFRDKLGFSFMKTNLSIPYQIKFFNQIFNH